MSPTLQASEVVAATVGLIFIGGGLSLAFIGRELLRFLLIVIGGLLGGALGFLVGEAVATVPARVPFGGHVGLIITIVLSLAGGLLGALFFGFLVKASVAFLGALMAATLAGFITGNPMVVLLAFAVAFAGALYFIEELAAIILAVVGAFLVSAGIFILTERLWLTLTLGLAVAVAGAIVQARLLGRSQPPPTPTSVPRP